MRLLGYVSGIGIVMSFGALVAGDPRTGSWLALIGFGALLVYAVKRATEEV